MLGFFTRGRAFITITGRRFTDVTINRPRDAACQLRPGHPAAATYGSGFGKRSTDATIGDDPKLLLRRLQQRSAGSDKRRVTESRGLAESSAGAAGHHASLQAVEFHGCGTSGSSPLPCRTKAVSLSRRSLSSGALHTHSRPSTCSWSEASSMKPTEQPSVKSEALRATCRGTLREAGTRASSARSSCSSLSGRSSVPAQHFEAPPGGTLRQWVEASSNFPFKVFR